MISADAGSGLASGTDSTCSTISGQVGEFFEFKGDCVSGGWLQAAVEQIKDAVQSFGGVYNIGQSITDIID